MVKKGYKQTEIGVIPEDWEVKKLGNIGNPTMCKRIFKSQTKKIGDIPFYKIGTFGKEADAYIDKKLFEEYKIKYPFPKEGDILISASGTIGRTVVYNGEDAYYQDSNIVWVDNNEKSIYNSFLKYYYQIVKWTTENTTISRLYNDILKEILIPIPPKSEQKAIATALSDMDNLIASLEALIAKKEHIKTATMQQLLTGKKRLDGFSGEWVEKKLGEVAIDLDNLRVPLNENQRNNMKGDIPYCGANGIVGYVNDYIVDDDIILMAEDGGYFDEYATRPIAYRIIGKAWINNHAHILKAKDSFSQDYLFYTLVHKDITKYLSSGTRAKLNKSEMYKIIIFCPKYKEEQQAIAQILSDMDKEIDVLKDKLNKTKAIKMGMMQELLMGKTRLKGETNGNI